MGIGKFFKNRLQENGDNRNTATGKASSPVIVGGPSSSPPAIAENHQEGRVPTTGNINKGPGAGAHNKGLKAASINNNRGHINFSNRDLESVPNHGNVNKGPGAGGINSGMKSGSINGNHGIITF